MGSGTALLENGEGFMGGTSMNGTSVWVRHQGKVPSFSEATFTVVD